MMTLDCQSFRATALGAGRFHLEIESPAVEQQIDRMDLSQIGHFLGVSRRTVYRLAHETQDPLPLVTGKGRPYALRSQLEAWAANNKNSNRAKRKSANNRVASLYR